MKKLYYLLSIILLILSGCSSNNKNLNIEEMLVNPSDKINFDNEMYFIDSRKDITISEQEYATYVKQNETFLDATSYIQIIIDRKHTFDKLIENKQKHIEKETIKEANIQKISQDFAVLTYILEPDKVLEEAGKQAQLKRIISGKTTSDKIYEPLERFKKFEAHLIIIEDKKCGRVTTHYVQRFNKNSNKKQILTTLKNKKEKLLQNIPETFCKK